MGLRLFANMLNASASQSGGGEPVFQGVYYVSENGTGDGLSTANPMSPADYLLLTLQANNSVYFLAGDEL